MIINYSLENKKKKVYDNLEYFSQIYYCFLLISNVVDDD
jgi:hypothetical protein